jgi:hypothetical protein
MSSKSKKRKQQIKVQYDFTLKQLDGVPSKYDANSGSLFIEWKKGHGSSNKGESIPFPNKGNSFSPNVEFGFTTHIERDPETDAFDKKLVKIALKFVRYISFLLSIFFLHCIDLLSTFFKHSTLLLDII